MPGTMDHGFTRSFAHVLDTMREPHELEAPSGNSAYRLLSLPTFSAPTMVRIDRGVGGWQIAGKMLALSLRRAPTTTLLWSRQRVLRHREGAEIERLLAALDLWTLPVTDDVDGLDGETWILEGKDSDRHHLIERWCPQYIRRLPALATLGLYMMMLARVPADSRVKREGGEWRRSRLEAMRASRRAAAEREQLHLEETSRRNVLAQQLALELEARGLTCPHCKRHSRDIRFVHGRPDLEWFFICRECGCSFTARDRLQGAGAARLPSQ